MPLRNFEIYGLGWAADAQSIPTINVSFNGSNVYTGPVTDYRIGASTDFQSYGDTTVAATGNPIASFSVNSVPAGNYKLEIGITGGDVTISTVMYSDTDIPAYMAITNLHDSMIDIPATEAITPVDIHNRYLTNTAIPSDLTWLEANKILITLPTGKVFPLGFEPKRNVTINGILQTDSRLDLDNQPPWHYVAGDSDIFACDLIVVKDARLAS